MHTAISRYIDLTRVVNSSPDGHFEDASKLLLMVTQRSALMSAANVGLF